MVLVVFWRVAKNQCNPFGIFCFTIDLCRVGLALRSGQFGFRSWNLKKELWVCCTWHRDETWFLSVCFQPQKKRKTGKHIVNQELLCKPFTVITYKKKTSSSFKLNKAINLNTTHRGLLHCNHTKCCYIARMFGMIAPFPYEQKKGGMSYVLGLVETSIS